MTGQLDEFNRWFDPVSPKHVNRLAPTVLAYVGDAVYEVVVRTAGARSGLSAEKLHHIVVQWVSADGQRWLLDQIHDSLSPDEKNIVRRGRNAKGGVPRTVDPATYRWSTGLEALIGYVYLSGKHTRITELMALAIEGVRKGQGPA